MDRRTFLFVHSDPFCTELAVPTDVADVLNVWSEGEASVRRRSLWPVGRGSFGGKRGLVLWTRHRFGPSSTLRCVTAECGVFGKICQRLKFYSSAYRWS